MTTHEGPRGTGPNADGSESSTDSIPLAILRAGRHNADQGVQETATWPRLVKRLRRARNRREGSVYVLGDFGGSGPRNSERCISRSALTLDYDAAPHDLPDRVRALGCTAAMHPTWRSTDEVPRWRVIIPLVAPVPADRYAAVVDAVAARIGADPEALDKCSRSAPQFMYWPGRPAGASYELVELGGPWLDADALLASADAATGAGEPEDAHGAPEAAHGGYDGPAYAALSPERQVQAREHVEGVVAYWRHRYADAADWPDGQRDAQGRGWEALARDGAYALAKLAVHPAYPLDADDADAAYLETLGPIGDNANCRGKWSRALAKAMAQPCAAPDWRSTPAEDFAKPIQGDAADDPEREEHEARFAKVRERLPRLDLDRLLDPNRPPREWVAEPLLSVGVSVALVAPAGARKSLFCLRLAIAIARGESWAGVTIPRARRVLYVDMELTEDDWAERLASFGVTRDEVASLDNLVTLLLPSLPPLDRDDGGKLLAAAVEAYGLAPGDLVILDSFQRVTEGAENDNDTTRSYYRHTGERLKRLGLTVLRTDNTGKDAAKGARGNSGKRDDVDAELLLTSDGDRLRVELGNKIRQRGAPELVLRVVQGDDGLTTFEPVDEHADERLLQAIDVVLSDGEWHTTNKLLGRCAPRGSAGVTRR